MDPSYSYPSSQDSSLQREYSYQNNHHKMAVKRPPRVNRKNEDRIPKSSLTTNFDPMKDRHMWAMWRTAVNGRIVDQVRENENLKSDPFAFHEALSRGQEGDNVYVKDLVTAPSLSKFIRLNKQSRDIANGLRNEGQGKLKVTQFIYYGLPRVTVNTNGYPGNGVPSNRQPSNGYPSNGYHPNGYNHYEEFPGIDYT